MKNRIVSLSASILIIFVLLFYTWGIWKFFTTRVPGGNDFLTHYSAWKAYFYYGHSPYSDEAALYTQNIIYGRPARPNEDQNRMAYPFYSIIVHAPLIFLEYPIARAIYMTFLQVALIAGVWMSLNLVKWRIDLYTASFLFIWTLLFYPAARGIILGQFAIFGFFSMVACLDLLKRGKEIYAGVILVLSTIKPTLVFLLIPFLLIWGVINRRYQFLIGFFGMLGILILGSLIFLQSWLTEWWFRITQYSGYTVGQSPVWLLTHQAIPSLGNWGEISAVLLLIAGMAWIWFRFYASREATQIFWVLGITLIVSNLIVPRSATTNYVMLLLPTIWIFSALDRIGRKGKILIWISLASTLVGYWWLHFATVIGNQEQPVMFLPYPLLLGIVLVCARGWLLNYAKKADLAL